MRMLILLVILSLAVPCLAQEGFYLSVWKSTPYEQRYQETVAPDTYEPRVYKWTETRPDLSFIPNAVIDMGEFDGKRIFYCLGKQDIKAPQYLGEDITKFADTAMWKPILYNNYASGASIIRGSVADWILAGKPETAGTWQPRACFGTFKKPLDSDIGSLVIKVQP